MQFKPRKLPPNDAPDYDQHVFVAWLCQTVIGIVPDVVFTSESYGDGFARSMTELTASDRPGRPPVEHVCFDLNREIQPISGSLIRENPSLHRAWMPAYVAARFVQRVAILGGESSGKSTLAAALAKALDTEWVAEYGRELWEKRYGKLNFEDLLFIAQTQIKREKDALSKSCIWLICDTTPLVTAFYSQALFGAVDPQLAKLANRQYNHTFVCAPDFEFVQDGTRRDSAFRAQQHQYYLDALERSKTPYLVLTGSVQERVETAKNYLHAKLIA
jgi:NadR type nicotinamide-nucleotide adenylyltransferase